MHAIRHVHGTWERGATNSYGAGPWYWEETPQECPQVGSTTLSYWVAALWAGICGGERCSRMGERKGQKEWLTEDEVGSFLSMLDYKAQHRGSSVRSGQTVGTDLITTLWSMFLYSREGDKSTFTRGDLQQPPWGHMIQQLPFWHSCTWQPCQG